METVSLLFGEALLFPPGSGYEYSNTGYILLAALIERITGRTLVEQLNRAVLAPAGLAPMADGDALLPRRASGYRRAGGAWCNALPLAARVPSGAGGLWATADDLVAWDRAVLSGRVLSGASRTAMFADGGHGYGLGWYVGQSYGRRLWSHGGFLSGFAAIKDTYPEAGLTIVVLGNTETAPAQALSRRLAALVFAAVPDTQLSVSDAVLARYAGYYRVAPRSVLGLTLEGGRLVATITGRGRIVLTPESDRVFAGDGETRIAFDIEPDGRPTGALLDEGGSVRSGPRIDSVMARRITARRIGRLMLR
jgi:CubicO group peptidase (beta-lactamase class C family)